MSELAANDQSPNAFAPSLFKEALDRAGTEFPDWHMTWADVVLVASEEVVRRATENRPAALLRRRWTSIPNHKGEVICETFNIDPKWSLTVSPYGTLWIIQRRLIGKTMCLQGLAFLFGPMPVCADSSEAAKRLAEYYHLNWRAQGGGMLWVDVDDPDWWNSHR